uniref:Steroid dehydrogenase n=2 Tax=Homalodisca liturata TaxID=320908 RepID=A0A1B6HER9_9HEMI
MLRVLEAIGVLALCIKGVVIFGALLKWIYKGVKASSFRLEETGRWAVITGATDGIGKAFAEALAEKGMDVVLISRTMSKLETVAKEIRDEYHVNTKVIAADFTADDIYDNIRKELSDLDIGVLVNNVGIAHPYPDRFLDLPGHDRVFRDMIQCNVTGVMAMCLVVLPGMCERRRGAIVNVGSMSAEMPNPMFTVYAATKAFVSKFSLDLASEYKRDGITVQCLTPGFVTTKISMAREPSWMAPTPERYVQSALKSVGYGGKSTGYFPHSLMLFSIHALQFISATLVYWIVTRSMEKFRTREMKKREIAIKT